MPTLDISSTESTSLAELGLPSIVLKAVEILNGDYTGLYHPIIISTVFPDGRSYQSLFHALQYWSNTKPGQKTDIPINEIIHYCSFTSLQVHSPEKVSKMRLTYAAHGNDSLIILMKKDLDGYTFSLPPETVELIYSVDKNAIPVRSIFVSYTVKADFTELHGKIYNHILPALTGLTNKKLDEIKVKTLIDAITRQEIIAF